MRIKLDENMPACLARILGELGHEAAFQREDVASWRRCFLVLSEHKLRVLRPPRR